MLDQPAEAIVLWKLGQVPIERLIVVPFVPLAEFAAHEEQLFPRMPIHPSIEHPEIGEFLPLVARHFIEKRSFPMHDLVVAKHEDEILLKSIDQGKGDAALMKTAMDGIKLHVTEEIVHPTHVPFEPEPKPAEVSRPGDTGPCS